MNINGWSKPPSHASVFTPRDSLSLSLGEWPCFGWSRALVWLNWHNELWAGAQPAMRPWSPLTLRFILSERLSLSITLSFTLFSPLSLLCHLSLFISSLHSCLISALTSLPVFLSSASLPSPIAAWILFYVKLTLIRRISAPSYFHISLNPLSTALAPLPEISLSCRPNKRREGDWKDKSMSPASLLTMNDAFLLHFPETYYKKIKKE